MPLTRWLSWAGLVLAVSGFGCHAESKPHHSDPPRATAAVKSSAASGSASARSALVGSATVGSAMVGSAAASAGVLGTPPSDAPSATAAPDSSTSCLSKEAIANDFSVHWKVENDLSVVRVAPDDALNLRSKPGHKAAPVGQLPHNQRGIIAMGEACRVGSNSMWLKVRSGNKLGWANAKYLVPTTPPQDRTKKYLGLAPGSFASKEALITSLQKKLAASLIDPEVPFKATLLGFRTNKGGATAVLHQCCYADDALAGEQAWLDLRESAGRWRIHRATEVNLCPRGALGSRCK